MRPLLIAIVILKLKICEFLINYSKFIVIYTKFINLARLSPIVLAPFDSMSFDLFNKIE